MPERLFQLGFDDQFDPSSTFDVTPQDFGGLPVVQRQRLILPDPRPVEPFSRFVREPREPSQINCPADIARYLINYIYTPFEAFDQEETWVLLLNTKYWVTHEVMVYRGTVNTVYIRPAELLKEAVRVNAPTIILSHCHPSGDPSPSPEDVQMTRTLYQAAALLNIELLDHLIIGDGRWVSLKERGIGFD